MLYGHMGEFKRAASRIVLIAAIGGFAVEASAEVSRSSSPFSNPFETRASAEPRVTGSLSGAVPRSASATASAAPIRLAMASPTTTSPTPKPVATKVASSKPAAAKSSGGWRAEGGTSINVAPGDSLATIANRYGVPSSAILSANGVSAGQVAPGRRIVIPVYSATGGSDSAVESAPKVVAKAPAKAAPDPVVTAAAAKPAPKVVATLPKAESRAKLADIAAAAAKPAPKVAKAAAQPAEKVAVKAVLAPKVVVAKAEPKPAPVKVAKVEASKVDVQKTAKTETKVVVAVTTKTPAPAPVKVAVAAPAKVEPTKATKAAATKAGAQSETVKVASAAVKEPEATGALPATPIVAAAPTAEFRWPARGRVITGFGGSGGNEGINIAVPDGTPVKAAEAGTVAYAGSEVKGYGNLVLIRHDNGFVSAYAHAGEIDVKRGQKVARGQVIAKSGQSGNVTSPQLHFEIRKGSTPIDPMLHLASN